LKPQIARNGLEVGFPQDWIRDVEVRRWDVRLKSNSCIVFRIASRGNNDTELGGKVGRASACWRVGLVVLSSNCCCFVWPRRSARQ
jgi:hypothetical protein